MAAGAETSAAPGELIVGFSDDTSKRESRDTVNDAGAAIDERLIGNDAAVVTVDSGVDIETAAAELAASDAVEFVEPNHILRSFGTTNDPYLLNNTLWGLYEIDAPTAWSTANGAGTVVAVIDSGVDGNHGDLSANLWSNPADPPNGVDDDGNGFVDDATGADFVSGDGTPDDEAGHGTHVAGTIAGVADNGAGVVGVAHGAKVMSLKFLDGGGSGTVADAIQAIDYAVAHGANVINASWGGPDYSRALEQAIARAGTAGVVVAAAAGNESNDNDASPTYPAAYRLSNMITVAAIGEDGRLADFSNYGPQSVHLAAPGVDILSTVDGRYEAWSGTSMAAPHVAGAAALLKSSTPSATAEMIVAALQGGVAGDNNLRGKVGTAGVLNVPGALTALGLPPAAPDTNAAPSRFRLRSPGRRAVMSRTGKIRFKWTPSQDTDLKGYAIYVDGRQRAFVADPDGASGPLAAPTMRSIKLRAGVHRWRVVAIDEAGNTRAAARGSRKGKVAVVRRGRR